MLSRFWHIADDPRLNFAFRDIQKRVAPAEFVFTGESSSFSVSQVRVWGSDVSATQSENAPGLTHAFDAQA